MRTLTIAGRILGDDYRPLVIPEIGINHGGSLERAIRMIDDVADAGGECVKFQSHSVDDEMIPNDVIPANSTRSIWDIMKQCSLTDAEERACKQHAEDRGLLFLSTPFSREAANRLDAMGVAAFKIGSGECNNLPLVRHIARFGRPIILSTGMNGLESIERTVEVLTEEDVPFALLHCTSLYPTPYAKIRLGAITELRAAFPDTVIGLSDHSLSNVPSIAAVALGASILERHFTSDMEWEGEDIEISMDPAGLRELIEGADMVHAASGGSKTRLAEEQPTIDFAYASVVTIRDIPTGVELSEDDIWVKRPGTGEIPASRLDEVIGRHAARDLTRGEQLRWADVE